MQELTIQIPYPKSDAGRKAWNKEYGFNSLYAGKHWSKRRQDAQFWHALTLSAVNNLHLRRLEQFDKPVSITYKFNDHMDVSNHGYLCKLIEDGLKGKVIQDDSQKYVKSMTVQMHSEPYIEVTITEQEPRE